MDNKTTIWKERCIWMAVLAFVIMLAVITFWLGGKGSEIVSHISFAAACSSILLAVTAIFYSFLEHGYSRQHIGQMDALIRDASSIMKDASRTVSEKATVFAEKAEKIEALAMLFESTEQPTTVSVTPSEHKYELNASISVRVILCMFYAVSQSYVLKKSMSLKNLAENIFPDSKKASEAVYWIGQGTLKSLESFLEKGSLEIGDEQQKANKLPVDFVNHISAEVDRRKKSLKGQAKEDFQQHIEIIDQYLAAQES